MPIEILPEGQPDWIEFSTTAGILFLGLDPFWKTKTGKTSPNYAIMYRGGQGFFDRSTNGGRTWTSILPGTYPSWFGSDDWNNYYYGERPYGMPSSEDPPLSSQLKYVAYSPNHANSGEHYVLCTYTLQDGGGISPSTWDVHITWLLYTTDDWVTHRWSMVKPYVYRAESAISNGTPTTLSFSNANKPEVYATRLSNTKVAIWVTGSGITEGVYIITESSGTITEEDFTAGAVDPIMFNYNGTALYWGTTYLDRVDSGVNIYRARTYEWDVSGTTPSLTTYNSGDLPSLGSTSQIGSGWAWHLDDADRLCWIYRIREGTDSTDTCQWHLFYFNVGTSAYSSTYTYHNDQQDSVPYNIDLCAMTIDDSHKMVVVEIEEWDWTGKGDPDWQMNEFIWETGTWNKYDETNFFSHLATATTRWRITPAAVCELAGDRVAFWITSWFTGSGTGVSRSPRVYTYDDVLNILYYDENTAGPWPNTNPVDGDGVESLDDEEYLHVVGYNKMDNPTPTYIAWIRHILNRTGSASDRMYRFGPDDTYPYSSYLVYSSVTQYDVVSLLTGYNADGSATMIRAQWVLNGSYTIDVDVATVAEHGVDDVISKLPSGGNGAHPLACSMNGTLVYMTTSEWYDSSDDSDLFSRIEYMTRQPDGQSGYVDFPASKAGWHWNVLGDGFTLTNHNSNAQYASLYPWATQTDGCLVIGLPWGVEFPSWPDQIWGVSPSVSWWWYLGANGYTDPVRGVFNYNDKIYALIKGSTALELWEEKSSISGGGADLQKVSNSSLVDAYVGIIGAIDTRDGTIVVAGVIDDPIVVATPSPWTVWSDLTLSHRTDKDVTGLVILL